MDDKEYLRPAEIAYKQSLKKIGELESRNAKLVQALEKIANYPSYKGHIGETLFDFKPLQDIAKKALSEEKEK